MATAPLALFASPSLACRRAMPVTGLTAAVRTPLVSSQTMQLFARDLAGATLSVELDAGVSCAEACDALCAKAGVPSAEVRLVLEGKQLDLDLPLADYSVEAGARSSSLGATGLADSPPGRPPCGPLLWAAPHGLCASRTWTRALAAAALTPAALKSCTASATAAVAALTSGDSSIPNSRRASAGSWAPPRPCAVIIASRHLAT